MNKTAPRTTSPKPTAAAPEDCKPTKQALTTAPALENNGESIDDYIRDKSPHIPIPTPTDLVAVARHITGAGVFPNGEDGRDQLLRDALRIWHHAKQLLIDYRLSGSVVTDMNPTERKEHMEFSVEHSTPLMNGDEIIKFMTRGKRPGRELQKLRKWLQSGTAPKDVKTLAHLKAPKDKGQVIILRHLYEQWNAKSTSDKNAEKGRKTAARKLEKNKS